ncbi:hypothetical protein ACE38W_20275 [Chitinophaga sp. Hz27]|uniref:hypothetical protein n=1 Tax=Chitinophaga sp. Hz27 TaxID=3347169 RepID=UPI0035D671D1
MEQIEQTFEQAKDWMKELQGFTGNLLELVKNITTGDFELPMHIPGIEADVNNLITRKVSLLLELKKLIRYQLLYANSDQYTQNLLFLLLKLYTEFRRTCRPLRIFRDRNTFYFDKHVSQEYKQGIADLQIIPANELASDIGDLVTISGYLLETGIVFSKQIIKVIRTEYSMKEDDIRALFDESKYGPIPVSLHHYKHQLLTPRAVKTKTHRLSWQGNLKQFAELIIELEKKGWIKAIQPGELQATVNALAETFDLSNTNKKENADNTQSLTQYLKPSEREAKVFTKRYNPQFNLINPNHTAN